MSKKNNTESMPTARSVEVVYESPPMNDADISAAAATRKETFARDTAANGVLVADGGAIRITVEHGALVVVDGSGGNQRSRRFDRATHGLSRLVVIGGSGLVTLDALNWCRRLGVPIVVLDVNGAPTLCSTPRFTDDGRLRRVQALALNLPLGLDIARSLIVRKLNGQADLLDERLANEGAAETIRGVAHACEIVESVEELRPLEATAAALYWQNWAGRTECEPHFATKDLSRIPPHWSRYEGRRSVLASMNSNRKAERPTNALLNYLYALLEVEAILSCQVVGLDPGLGLVHADMKGRSSFALDLIEPVRPKVDAYVLDVLERRTFRKTEFLETEDGHCRLRPPLTHELAESLPIWAKEIAPVAEWIAHSFGEALSGKYVPTTPLSREKTRTAQAVVKARKAVSASAQSSRRMKQKTAEAESTPTWSCPDCGAPVTNLRHVRCEACINADPRHTPEVRRHRGAAIAARKRALRDWEAANPDSNYDPEMFRREILPGLAEVRLADIMEAAGISKSYASQVRSGECTPHVSTWESLKDLAFGQV
jgi:CRISPR-associated endonuclease Cas1